MIGGDGGVQSAGFRRFSGYSDLDCVELGSTHVSGHLEMLVELMVCESRVLTQRAGLGWSEASLLFGFSSSALDTLSDKVNTALIFKKWYAYSRTS
jgi:hypothetical protein